jgi:hypothetical protein
MGVLLLAIPRMQVAGSVCFACAADPTLPCVQPDGVDSSLAITSQEAAPRPDSAFVLLENYSVDDQLRVKARIESQAGITLKQNPYIDNPNPYVPSLTYWMAFEPEPFVPYNALTASKILLAVSDELGGLPEDYALNGGTGTDSRGYLYILRVQNRGFVATGAKSGSTYFAYYPNVFASGGCP